MPRLTLTDDEAEAIGPILERYRHNKALVHQWNSAVGAAANAAEAWLIGSDFSAEPASALASHIREELLKEFP